MVKKAQFIETLWKWYFQEFWRLEQVEELLNVEMKDSNLVEKGGKANLKNSEKLPEERRPREPELA